MRSESRSVGSDSLRPHGLYNPWNSPGQNTGVSSLSLLQGVFPIQGSNPDLPHCRHILYQLSHQGSPRNTGVVKAIPSPEDLPNPGIELRSPALQADSLPTELSVTCIFVPSWLLLLSGGVGCDGECAFPYPHHVSCDLI